MTDGLHRKVMFISIDYTAMKSELMQTKLGTAEKIEQIAKLALDSFRKIEGIRLETLEYEK